MKTEPTSSNPKDTQNMESLFKPLGYIQEVNPPHFLRAKIDARIEALSAQVSPRTAAWAFGSLALLAVLTLFAAFSASTTRHDSTGSELLPHNELYSQP